MNTLKSNLKLLFSLTALLVGAFAGFAQTTIVNYDFNTGSSYATLSPTLAAGITATASSTEAWQTYPGITSGAGAFTSNPTAGNGLGMTNSSGANTKYFQFQFAGSSLSTYFGYKIYCQAQRASTGATTLTLAYSTSGTNYTNLPATQLPGNGSYSECTFDLSSIVAINTQTLVFFRVMAGGASGTGTLSIDNLQIRACTSPTMTLTSTTPTICTGSSATVTASGATTYTWHPGGATTASVAVNPTTTAIYTVSGTSGSCTNAKTIIITVNPLPTVSIIPSSSVICTGSSSTLTASGAASYTWSPGGATTTSIAVSPTTTTIYTITGKSAAGCINTETLSLTVNPLPTLTVSPSTSTICAGSSTTLTATGATSYTWNPGGAATASVVISPTTTTVYTVTGTSAAGCNNTNTSTITVNALPTLSVSTTATAICTGFSATLTAAGASSYTWSPGGVNTLTFAISPTVTTSYTLTGANAAGCISTKTKTLTVNPLPTAYAGTNQIITCTNTLVTLTSTTNAGSPTYSWTPAGISPTAAVNTTSVIGTYTLKVTNAITGCLNTGTVSVTQNTTAPTASASSTGTLTCATTTIALTGGPSSGVTYTWTGPGFSGGTSSQNALGTAAGTYSLKVTSTTNGCTATATTSVTQNTVLPNVSAGSSSTLSPAVPTATLNGSSTTSGVTFSWTPAGNSPTVAINTTSVAGTYSLAVKNPNNGCVSTATVIVVDRLSATATVTDYKDDTLKGIVNLIITGGHPPYNIAWNGGKLPSLVQAYHTFINSYPGLVMDSVIFQHQIDSLKQRTTYVGLNPDTYTVTVYDNVGDTLKLKIYVGVKINDWAYVYGAVTNTCTITDRTVANTKYSYGTGQCIGQSGAYSAGNSFAVPLAGIILSEPNALFFTVPDNTYIAYVGLQEKKADLNGDFTDMSQNTMFRFNGNGTYDIFFNSVSTYSGTFASGDNFMLRTDPVTNLFSYYKNETFVTQINASALNSVVNGFLPKVVFGGGHVSITGLKLIGGFTPFIPRVTGVITDVSCDNACGGSINAAGYYPLFNTPLNYQLFTLGGGTPLQAISATGVTNVTFTNLCAGVYTIKYNFNKITFSILVGGVPFPTIVITPASVSQNFEVGYKPSWTNVTSNVTVSGSDNSLTRTTVPTGVWDAGASSFNTLLNTAGSTQWMEWQATGSNLLGLSATDPNTNYSSVNYGIFDIDFYGTRIYGVFHNGTLVSGIGINTAAGKFRIEKTSSNLNFKLNTASFTTITGITPNPNMIADASMYVLNGTLKHPRVSFGCNFPAMYAQLKKELDGTYFQTYDNALLFTTDGDYSNTGLTYSIYDFTRAAATGLPINSSTLNNGDNRYTVDITTLTPGYYVLELLNQKKEKLVLRFKK